MIPLNPFIQKNKPRLVKFIDNLSVSIEYNGPYTMHYKLSSSFGKLSSLLCQFSEHFIYPPSKRAGVIRPGEKSSIPSW